MLLCGTARFAWLFRTLQSHRTHKSSRQQRELPKAVAIFLSVPVIDDHTCGKQCVFGRHQKALLRKANRFSDHHGIGTARVSANERKTKRKCQRNSLLSCSLAEVCRQLVGRLSASSTWCLTLLNTPGCNMFSPLLAASIAAIDVVTFSEVAKRVEIKFETFPFDERAGLRLETERCSFEYWRTTGFHQTDQSHSQHRIATAEMKIV